MQIATISTIGFTKSTAESFFQRLQKAGVKKLFDVRLNSTSQLAGFAKSGDLPYFLKTIADIEYVNQPLLAPTASILDSYKKEKGRWEVYQDKFIDLLSQRKIEKHFKIEQFDGACLLCSESTPEHCHRRLVCDYLNAQWGSSLKVTHL